MESVLFYLKTEVMFYRAGTILVSLVLLEELSIISVDRSATQS